MPSESIEAVIRELADLEAIRNLARRYAHCVWQRDALGAADLFTEDAVMDTGDRAALVGRATILETYLQMFDASVFRPFVHNHVIDLDGDRATGTCYLDLHAIIDGKRMRGMGYYEDVYVRTADGWKFQRRSLNMLEYGEAGSDRGSSS